MRPIPIDNAMHVLEYLMQLIPYSAVRRGVGGEGVGEGEEGQEEAVGEVVEAGGGRGREGG